MGTAKPVSIPHQDNVSVIHVLSYHGKVLNYQDLPAHLEFDTCDRKILATTDANLQLEVNLDILKNIET